MLRLKKPPYHNSIWARILLASGLAIVAPPPALAQEPTFLTPLEGADLNQKQNQALANLTSLSTTGESELVRVDVNALLQGSQVRIELPDKAIVTVGTTERNTTGDEQTEIVGRTESLTAPEPTEQNADVSTFIVTGDSVMGSIVSNGGLYRIQPLGGGAHLLFKVDQFPPEHPETNQLEQNRQDLPPIVLNELADQSVAELKVLVGYTPAVRDRVNDIDALVRLAFLETNTSYRNSAVLIDATPATASPVLVNYDETGDFEKDLGLLKNPGDGVMDKLLTKRDEVGADVVVLLVDNNSYCGLATDILGSKESAFALVYYDCATGNLSFGHEIGHIQGARHNPEADPTMIPFAYGHGFMDNVRKRRSVMSYDCPSHCPRLPQWARPTEWGNSDVSNDARVLNETRGMISSFR